MDLIELCYAVISALAGAVGFLGTKYVSYMSELKSIVNQLHLLENQTREQIPRTVENLLKQFRGKGYKP